jgi:hypothetical protein
MLRYEIQVVFSFNSVSLLVLTELLKKPFLSTLTFWLLCLNDHFLICLPFGLCALIETFVVDPKSLIVVTCPVNSYTRYTPIT